MHDCIKIMTRCFDTLRKVIIDLYSNAHLIPYVLYSSDCFKALYICTELWSWWYGILYSVLSKIFMFCCPKMLRHILHSKFISTSGFKQYSFTHVKKSQYFCFEVSISYYVQFLIWFLPYNNFIVISLTDLCNFFF